MSKKKESTYKFIYFISGVIGICLMIPEVGIYRETMISFKVLFLLVLCVSLIGFLFIQKNYRRVYQTRNLFSPFAQSVISFGFTACYLFMALNYYLAHSEEKRRTFPVLNKRNIDTEYQKPAIEIDYDGIRKQLVFYRSEREQVGNSRQVVLTIRKGLFGFDVFNDIDLR